MNQNFRPPPDFIDPRSVPGFRPEHWPLCNGGESPGVGSADLHDLRCVEFLAAYYRVNCRYAELDAISPGTENPAKHGALLEDVHAALSEVDALEDKYAPIGFYGEPEMNGVYYRSIRFVRPELPRVAAQAVSISSHVAIPGLEDIPPSELQGPARVFRIHGKVDL